MKHWMKFLLAFLGIPKSIWINFRSLPIKDAIFLPIIVSPLTKIVSTEGRVRIDTIVRPGMISFGLSGYGLAVANKCIIQNNGLLVFHGKTRFGGGIEISCGGHGVISFGEACIFTGNCSIICQKGIEFGKECLVAFNTQFMDADLHTIMEENEIINADKRITIGNHVWICSHVNVLKGSAIQSDCVVGSQTLINKKFDENNCIIAGNPASIKKKNIIWVL